MLDVGQNILNERLKKGVTQAELARRSGVSQPNLSAIETGGRDLTVQTLTRIATALDTSPGELLSDKQNPEPSPSKHLDRYALDRVARLASGQTLTASTSEKQLADQLVSVMQSKIGLWAHRARRRQSTRSLNKNLSELKEKLGTEILDHLIQRVEKNLASIPIS